MTIGFWLSNATKQLVEIGVASARLDAELILSHTVKHGRTFLHSHPDAEIDMRLKEIADSRLLLRLDRIPLAYIVGHKDFFGRRFKVTPSTLIPRPESEAMIQILQKIVEENHEIKNHKLIDVGTGSGCLGITAKLEFPSLDVSMLDISNHALNVAKENAKNLDADVAILRSDLLSDFPFKSQIILANLPYVDPTWELSPELQHEPEVALFASDEGLKLIKTLIKQARDSLEKGGHLLIEADLRQHDAIKKYATTHNFRFNDELGLILDFVV